MLILFVIFHKFMVISVNAYAIKEIKNVVIYYDESFDPYDLKPTSILFNYTSNIAISIFFSISSLLIIKLYGLNIYSLIESILLLH